MNVLAISSRDLVKGSTQYRIAQYANFLKQKGIHIEFIKRDTINAATLPHIREFDLVFNQKCLMRGSLSKAILSRSARTLFDFDDAIYTRPGTPYSLFTALRVKRRLGLWLERADVVTTANEVLARYARQYRSSVVIVPMAVDTDHWSPAPDQPDRTATIGWTGAPVNLPQLERLGPVLVMLLKKYPHVTLAVSSGRKPDLGCPFEYYSFQPGTEADFVRRLDIGLLPLSDDEFTRGKSPIKAIQYLACGVPVVGNIFGATAEILNATNSIAIDSEQDWFTALERLINDRKLAQQMGQAGRQFVLERHNSKRTGEQLFKLFLGATQPLIA